MLDQPAPQDPTAFADGRGVLQGPSFRSRSSVDGWACDDFQCFILIFFISVSFGYQYLKSCLLPHPLLRKMGYKPNDEDDDLILSR